MRAVAVAIVALASACAAPLRGAVHHHPEDIYAHLATQPGGYSASAPPAVLSAPVVVIAESWGDRVLSPTGVYLDDWNPEGVMAETYLTPHLTDHLYLRSLEHLRAAGAEVRRSYGPRAGHTASAAGETLRVLRVEIMHAELHRWARKELFQQGEGTVDLARVDYHFAWADAAGAPVSEGSGRIELLLPPDGDDLDAIAARLVGAALAELR